ncbi:replication initiator protein A [Priestia megaterium]|uniref:replication initiator protein A n=1 Tax=Priestia megaterium TaxID=1404 RepID=UPI001B39ECD3|nr:replication initiator protein A [Priestia megaterium]MBQ4867479.1 replication initiator protein A [Priestia megaterium]
MKKQYITKAYINDLTDKEKATGVFFSSPKVVVKGDKYREKLKPIEKLLYQELYDMTKKAAHDNQVDSKGNVYIEVSYIFLAVALGVSDSTIQRILSKKTNSLYTLGLLAIKERKDKSTTQYYVMAPDYNGDDETFLTQDVKTMKMQEKAKELVAKKNRTTTSKRETGNEQLEKERTFDTVADTAHYEVMEREFKDNMPDFLEETDKPKAVDKEIEQEQQESTKEDELQEYKRIMKDAKSLGAKFNDNKRMNELRSIVVKHFGPKRLMDSTVKDLSALRSCYEQMKREFNREWEVPNF